MPDAQLETAQAPASPALFQIISIEGEILGAPGAKLRKALEGAPVRFFTPCQSL